MKHTHMLRAAILASLLSTGVQANEPLDIDNDQVLIDRLATQEAEERSAYDAYFQKQQYRANQARDCRISTNLTIAPDQPVSLDIPSLFVNQLNAEPDCFSNLSATFDETRDDWAMVVRVDARYLAPESDLAIQTGLPGLREDGLRLTGVTAQLPRLERHITLDAEQHLVDQAHVVISNNCDGLTDCHPALTLSTQGIAAEVDLDVTTLYVRPSDTSDQHLKATPGLETSSSNRNSSGFVNGDFSDYDTGWTWRSGDHTGFGIPGDCQDLNFPTPTQVLKPRVYQSPNGTVQYGWHGGGYGTAFGDPRKTRHFDLAQTVTVPLNSNLKFRQKSTRAQENNMRHATTMRVVAQDLTTGQLRVMKKITHNADTGFQTYTINTADMGGHLVKFRFYSCGEVASSTINLGIYGSWAIDDVRFVDRPTDVRAKPKSGQWYDPNDSGTGLHISRNANDIYSVFWYTFTSTGKPIWYMSGAGEVVNGVSNQTLYKVSWNTAANATSLRDVGNIRLEMTSNSSLRFKWNLDSIGGSSGYDGTIDMVQFHGQGSITGNWFEPQYSGWGISTSYQNSSQGPDTVVLAFTYEGSQPVWTLGTLEGLPDSGQEIDMLYFTSTEHCPGCAGSTPPSYQNAGKTGFMLNPISNAGRGWTDLRYPGGLIWKRGRINNMIFMSRLSG